MVELKEILLSGDIKDINLDGTSVRDTIHAMEKGIMLPLIPASEANENSLFFNTDNARVCYKSGDGLVFKLKMVLV